jgi:phosphoglycerate kinase
MIAFPRLLPSAAGLLLAAEVEGLNALLDAPARPAVFVLGGLKVSDGFSMMGRVLGDGLADRVLTAGVLGELFLMADGVDLGGPTEAFIADRDLTRYVDEARALLADHRDRISVPVDVAVLVEGSRRELPIADLPVDDLIVDLGASTIATYEVEIAAAGTIFVNGPAGAYEHPGADVGTRRLWAAVAGSGAMTAIGGGDTVASASTFVDLDDISFVSTGGGALIRYVGGEPLPLFEALRS